MKLGEFQKIIADKEKKLIAEGVNPTNMAVSISTKLVETLGLTLTPASRFQGFYGLYPIEVLESEDEEPRFAITGSQ